MKGQKGIQSRQNQNTHTHTHTHTSSHTHARALSKRHTRTHTHTHTMFVVRLSMSTVCCGVCVCAFCAWVQPCVCVCGCVSCACTCMCVNEFPHHTLPSDQLCEKQTVGCFTCLLCEVLGLASLHKKNSRARKILMAGNSLKRTEQQPLQVLTRKWRFCCFQLRLI